MRYALPNSQIMIHQPLGGFQGQATDVDIHAREMLRIKERLNTMLAENTGKSYDEIETEFAGCGYGKFKPAVGEAVVETLRPIREEASRIMKDKAYLEQVYRGGAEKAGYVAEKTLRKVYKKVGFVAK